MLRYQSNKDFTAAHLQWQADRFLIDCCNFEMKMGINVSRQICRSICSIASIIGLANTLPARHQYHRFASCICHIQHKIVDNLRLRLTSTQWSYPINSGMNGLMDAPPSLTSFKTVVNAKSRISSASLSSLLFPTRRKKSFQEATVLVSASALVLAWILRVMVWPKDLNEFIAFLSNTFLDAIHCAEAHALYFLQLVLVGFQWPLVPSRWGRLSVLSPLHSFIPHSFQ